VCFYGKFLQSKKKGNEDLYFIWICCQGVLKENHMKIFPKESYFVEEIDGVFDFNEARRNTAIKI